MTPDIMTDNMVPESMAPESMAGESMSGASMAAPEEADLTAVDFNGIGKTLIRKSNWEDDLSVYLAGKAQEPFCWGSHDCALFAASAVEAMTGTDPAADFRGQYDSQTGARAALRSIGHGTLLKTYQARFAEIAPAFAKRGDLIWNGFAIGVCNGPDAVFLGDDGLVLVPRLKWKRAFEVPFA